MEQIIEYSVIGSIGTYLVLRMQTPSHLGKSACQIWKYDLCIVVNSFSHVFRKHVVYGMQILYYILPFEFLLLTTFISPRRFSISCSLFVSPSRRSMNKKEDFMSEPFIVKTDSNEETTLHDYDLNNNSQGNTSLSKTCFHGINALSGLILPFSCSKLYFPLLICSPLFFLIFKFYNSWPRIQHLAYPVLFTCQGWLYLVSKTFVHFQLCFG